MSKDINNNEISWRWVLVGFVVFLLAAGLAGQSDYEEALRAEKAYCSNVKLFNETNGTRGWPDYDEKYDEVCT